MAPGIKITSHVTGQQVAAGELRISGISTDNATTNCKVYVDWNDLKPFQNATATGTSGINDYSNWTFTYTGDYHLITEGTNELTSKISCFDIPSDITSANSTKYYTVNVTGMTTQNNMTASAESSRNNTSFSNQESVVSNNGSSNYSSTKSTISSSGSGKIVSSQSTSNGHCMNKVISGSGNDILSSKGDCDDEFSGGSGADQFTCGMGKDIITDFNEEEGDIIVDSKNCESIQKQRNP